MKIAIIGDLFVRTAFFEEYVRRHVAHVVHSLEIVSVETDWPNTPLQHNAEVREFVGDNVWIGDSGVVAVAAGFVIVG